ncbi:unnamed protein product [Danaus chrysippus]|uniref:(African queen) hypothetical protein n=1 Tax=Danaus chrysippus TaxID=151541 RepID=A0A8J2R2F8_9NEOP|nr:unnamed protein product [Danaus chrysippus]
METLNDDKIDITKDSSHFENTELVDEIDKELMENTMEDDVVDNNLSGSVEILNAKLRCNDKFKFNYKIVKVYMYKHLHNIMHLNDEHIVDLFGFSKSQLNSIRFAFNKIQPHGDYDEFKMANFQFNMSEDDIFERLMHFKQVYKISSIVQMSIAIKSTNPNRYSNLVKRVKEHFNYKIATNNVKLYSRKTNVAIERLVIDVSRDPYMHPVIGKPILL